MSKLQIKRNHIDKLLISLFHDIDHKHCDCIYLEIILKNIKKYMKDVYPPLRCYTKIFIIAHLSHCK